jgi:ATP-binding cassette, subfamily B, bacterial HlyB/CyaB
MWQDFQQVRISVNRLGDILNAPPEPAMKAGRVTLPKIKGDIEFDNVTFRYRADGPEVLRQLSLKIPAGQVVGVIGASGSGKSTLAKLLQRLYIPESGRVLVDGTDLGMVDPAWLRRQIGVVPQESVLMNRSVRDNIALADRSVPMERVVRAATLAGAHDFIMQLPEGYDTQIEERGLNLSGGQRQRVAIARALLMDPQVLIFDEATSALDAESEEVIQRNMSRIVKGRTVVIVAHRLSALRICDRILTIERGEVLEDGVPHELRKQAGPFGRLVRKQQLADC